MNERVRCGGALTVPEVRAVARDSVPVELDDGVGDRVLAERRAIDDVIARGVPAYGVTTGLGARSSYPLPADELAEFSVRTVRGRANAVGEPLPADTVRAAMLVRLNGLARGGSGASLAVLEQLAGMLNRGVHPVVPGTGSIGAADLCLLAHIGQVMIGEGRAEHGGEVRDGGEALRRAGLEPLVLGPKDGLAVCNANSVTAGAAALAVADTQDLLDTAQAVAAVTFEGFRANTSPLDPRVQAARPAPGQQAAASGLLGLLRGGLLTDPANARRVQDPVSIRCVSQVHGALISAVEFVRPGLDAELAGAGDNPLVLDGGDVLSTGNFHTTALALALDALALAVCQTASLSAQRMQRLLAERLTDLPANLAPAGPASSGFAPLAKTGQALVAEIRQLATPTSVDTRVGADDVEDDSSNAALAALRLPGLLRRLRLVLAVEAVVATQAVELAAPARVGEGAAAVVRAVRSMVPPLDEDRASGADVQSVADRVLGSADLLAEVRAIR